MKLTVVLPGSLVREVKLRALNEGKKLKDVIAELLQQGLNSPDSESKPPQRRMSIDPELTVPVILCRHAPAPAEQLTPDKLHDLLIEPEVKRNVESR